MELNVFINHTHHAAANWSKEQQQAACQYGPILDMAAPEVDADWDERQVQVLAEASAEKILAQHPAAVLCQGEFTYTFALTRRLQQAGIPVVAACSVRRVEERTDEQGNTERISLFQFIRFRQYAVI